MRAAMELAGYTLSESDELRKAISKKKKDKLVKHREKFIKGAVERGIPEGNRRRHLYRLGRLRPLRFQ